MKSYKISQSAKESFIQKCSQAIKQTITKHSNSRRISHFFLLNLQMLSGQKPTQLLFIYAKRQCSVKCDISHTHPREPYVNM